MERNCVLKPYREQRNAKILFLSFWQIYMPRNTVFPFNGLMIDGTLQTNSRVLVTYRIAQNFICQNFLS